MMMLESVQGLSLADAIEPAATLKSAAVNPSLATEFSQRLNDVNAALTTAENNVQASYSGENIELHDVMLSLEQAKVELSFILQVRNKLLESYQEIIRMPV